MADETTTDPAMLDTVAEDVAEDASLESVITAANLQYGLKNYTAAAELYSQATERQAEQNGEMALENAELLYLYGRCLYHVAVAKSDVLGGKVAGEEKKTGAKPKRQGGGSKDPGEATAAGAEKAIEAEVEAPETDKGAEEGKPYFQFVEQESEGEDEGDGVDAEDGDADAQEDEDDFANAYEILDVARVLLSRQLEELNASDPSTIGKGKAAAITTDDDASPLRQVQTRLADTHDLQAEISLENERFADAVSDQRAALLLKTDLHPPESSLLAEAHFKLSLALEFASVTEMRDAQQQQGGQAAGAEAVGKVDEAMREEAARAMEAAIASCRLRVSKEEAELESLQEAARVEKEKSVTDVKEMIEDMEQRLKELRAPTMPENPLAALAGTADGANPLQGLLGSLLSQTPAQQRTSLEAATQGANDLSGLVRHRKKPSSDVDAAEEPTASTGKRKADELGGEDGGGEKRAKSEAL